MTQATENLRALTEASAWRVRLTEGDVETTPAFEAWRDADPLHAAAWRSVSEPLAWLGTHAASPDIVALRAAALHRARKLRPRQRPLARRLAPALAAASLALFIAGGIAWRMTAPQIYKTTLAERRTLTLQDGSRVTLDAGSEVRVRLAPRARRLELVRGQARFDVAHDTGRPFTVRAGRSLVVATGTSFNVDLLGRAVSVTLLEGRVTVLHDETKAFLPLAIAPPQRGGQSSDVLGRLTPGQQLVVALGQEAGTRDAAAAPQIAAIDPRKAVAWETGQLVFDDDRLEAVAARIGRYGSQKVVVEASAAELTLSGVFNAGDLTTFVDVVQRALPVTAAQEADGTIRLARRP